MKTCCLLSAAKDVGFTRGSEFFGKGGEVKQPLDQEGHCKGLLRPQVFLASSNPKQCYSNRHWMVTFPAASLWVCSFVFRFTWTVLKVTLNAVVAEKKSEDKQNKKMCGGPHLIGGRWVLKRTIFACTVGLHPMFQNHRASSMRWGDKWVLVSPLLM